MYVKNIQIKTKNTDEASAANLASVDLELINGELNFSQIELETNLVNLGVGFNNHDPKPIPLKEVKLKSPVFHHQKKKTALGGFY